jgi:Domain of unknown function (DUF4388)
MTEPESTKSEGNAFSGRLDNIPLPEVLNFLAVTSKSGRLGLTRRDGQGLILMRRGRIIYAASSSVRTTFGNILVSRGVIDEKALLDALERQHFAQEEKRLGQVLVEMGRVSPEDVEEAVRYQIGIVLTELCQWTSGFFKFDAVEIPEKGEIEVDAQDFVATEGLSTDRLLLEVATQLDESNRAAASGEPAPPDKAPLTPSRGTAAVRAGAPSISFEGLVSDLQTPVLRGEITVMLMRLGARVLGRGVLFAVRGDELAATGHFGFEGHPHPPHDLRFSIAEHSVLSEVVQRKETYRGPLPAGAPNEAFAQLLGSDAPGEVVVVPMIVGGSVATLFYGDDLPSRRPVGEIRPLEMLMTEAGLEMERQALEGRIKSFERNQRRQEFLRALQMGQEQRPAPAGAPPVTGRGRSR